MLERHESGECVFFDRGSRLCIVHRDLGEPARRGIEDARRERRSPRRIGQRGLRLAGCERGDLAQERGAYVVRLKKSATQIELNEVSRKGAKAQSAPRF